MDILTSALMEAFADSSFARLFTQMNGWTIALFAVGLVLCVVEMCIPGFGACGISGVTLIVAGIVLRMVCGGDLLMLLYMVLIALVLFVLMFWVFSRLITKSRLSQTALFHTENAVPFGTTEGTKDFSHLLGAEGVTQTVLHPVGRVTFGSEVVDAVARDGYISANTCVVVLFVEGQRIVVTEKEE